MAGGTTLQGRNYVIDRSIQSMGTATGTSAFTRLTVPATGAEIVEAYAVVATAGGATGSATATFQLQNTSGSTLTTAAAAVDNESVADTKVFTVTGNGVSAGNQGARLWLSMTMAGTINTAMGIDLTIVWAL